MKCYLKSKGPKWTATIMISVILVLIFSSVALASYIYTALLNTHIATAEEDFYFTSNLLTDQTAIPTYQITHDWQASSSATISFELRNYENPLNISNREIGYTVVADPVGGSTSGTISSGGSGGRRETVNLTVPAPPDLQMPLEVMVTATATSPYSKILRGRFIISPAISYHMTENTGLPVATLTITLAQSAEVSRNVIISWTEGADPDMTNPIVTGATSIDLAHKTLTTALNTAAIYELVFFKQSGETHYSGVTVSGM